MEKKNHFWNSLFEQSVSYNTMTKHFVQNDQYLYLICNENERPCVYFLQMMNKNM